MESNGDQSLSNSCIYAPKWEARILVQFQTFLEYKKVRVVLMKGEPVLLSHVSCC